MDINSDQLLTALRADLQTKIELEQERLAVEQKRMAEVQTVADAHRRLAGLGDIFAKALAQLKQYQQIDDIVRELTIELPRQLDRLEKILLVILSAQGKSIGAKRDTQELETDILKQHVASLRRRTERLQRSLDILKEQQATYGLQTPVNIVNQIFDIENELKAAQTEIEFFREK